MDLFCTNEEFIPFLMHPCNVLFFFSFFFVFSDDDFYEDDDEDDPDALKDPIYQVDLQVTCLLVSVLQEAMA